MPLLLWFHQIILNFKIFIAIYGKIVFLEVKVLAIRQRLSNTYLLDSCAVNVGGLMAG